MPLDWLNRPWLLLSSRRSRWASKCRIAIDPSSASWKPFRQPYKRESSPPMTSGIRPAPTLSATAAAQLSRVAIRSWATTSASPRSRSRSSP